MPLDSPKYFTDVDDALLEQHSLLVLAKHAVPYWIKNADVGHSMRALQDLYRYFATKDIFYVWDALHDIPPHIVGESARDYFSISDSYLETIDRAMFESGQKHSITYIATRNDADYVRLILESNDYFRDELSRLGGGRSNELSLDCMLANPLFGKSRSEYLKAARKGGIVTEGNKLILIESLAEKLGVSPEMFTYLAPPGEPLDKGRGKVNVVNLNSGYPLHKRLLWKLGF